MNDYSARLAEAMKHAGYSTQQLADALGISYQAVRKIVNRQSTAFTAENNSKAAKVLRVNADWLATGQGSMLGHTLQAEPGILRMTGHSMEMSNIEHAPQLRGARRIPVVGEVKGGDDGYLEELQYPVGHGEGYVEYWCKDPTAYAVRVKGDSMHPRYRAGEFVVVSPGIEAQPGSDVVVALRDGRKLLKQLNWQRDSEVQLLSINNHFAPLTLSQSEVLWVHRVAGSVPRDALIRE
jgi:phage repressor protein C with HTH and peptisase S24 domain